MGLVRRRWRLCVWLAMMVGMSVPAVAIEATLVADAHVNRALPGVNSGTISNLNVGAGYTALMQFDLGLLPGGTTAAQVSRAVLRVYCNRVDTAGLVSVQPVNAGWGEYSVTYGTLPALGSAVQAFQVGQAGAYFAVDVTAVVQGWVTTPGTNNGLALTAGTAGTAVQFDSKENDLTGHAAELDITLVSQGPVGPVGPIGLVGATGAMGLAGPAGLTGPAGPVGPIGAAGAMGATGPMGPQGLPGLAGPMGPIGAQGPQGLQGIPGPAGVQGLPGAMGPMGLVGPMGAQGVPGPVGAAGVAGPVGPAGATGAMGPAGPVGATGAVGLVYRGVYAAGTNYGLNDAVTYKGASYISLAASNVGQAPDVSPGGWSLLAAQGAAGVAGPAGAVGAMGPQGVAGAVGAAGPAGATGPAGMTYRGAWSVGTSYAVSDAVLYGGTTYVATASAAGLQPDLYPAAWGVLAAQGSAGATGPAGAAATVSVGTVTTGLAGTAATVTNSGTANAAVLNFTIPQGAAGTSGSGGGGTSGTSFLSMYHAVSFNFNFYSVNNPNSSASEGAAVLTWVPAACTATTLTVYSQQSNAITVTLREGAPGSMVDTALSCVAASGGSCSVTGSVAVAGGSFLDLSVNGASGTPAGVWTEVSCN